MKKLLIIALLIVGVFGQDKNSSNIKFELITGEIIKYNKNLYENINDVKPQN